MIPQLTRSVRHIKPAVIQATRSFGGAIHNEDKTRWFNRGTQSHQIPEPKICAENLQVDYGYGEMWKVVKENLEGQRGKHQDSMEAEHLEYAIAFATARYETQKYISKKPTTPAEMAKLDRFASVLDNVGDKQGAELDYRVINGFDTKDEYWMTPCLYGDFGTEEHPCILVSETRVRYAGCLGGYDGEKEHDLLWFMVRAGPKHRCPACGQIFQLVTTDACHHQHPLHDPTRDYTKNAVPHPWMYYGWQDYQMQPHQDIKPLAAPGRYALGTPGAGPMPPPKPTAGARDIEPVRWYNS